LTREQVEAMQRLNRRYRERHGFPCIVALRLHAARESVVAEMERRAGNDSTTGAEERVRADRPYHARPAGADRRWVSSPRTCWIPRAASPAPGIPVELYRLENETGTLVAKATTNRDGRTDAPLLEGASLRTGTYQLVFQLGAYLAGEGFLDAVPIRFTIADAAAHYHVPLLCSPWGYTTYRGS
jgi:2-oxo-4-hydroxy-4-carboxy-5-ureidoimidazoline decarboxylase